jgi:nitrate reductase delta subunit
LCDVEEAKESLGDSIDIIALIGGHLKKNKSPYKVIFAALEALSKIKVNKFRVAEAIENSPKEPETLDELDELWKEQEAFSGGQIIRQFFFVNKQPFASIHIRQINHCLPSIS